MNLRSSTFLLPATLLCLCTTSSFAAPVACPTTTLNQYFSYDLPFSPCGQGELIFGGFAFSETTNTGLITASDIQVTPTGIGFNFFTDLFNSDDPNNPYQRYLIYYEVDPAPILAGDEISLDPPSGGIVVTKYTCLDSPLFIGNLADPSTYLCSIGNKSPYTLKVDTTNPPGSLSDAVVYPHPGTFVPVLLVIELQGVVQGLEGIVSDTPTVPEPSTFGMLAGALVGGAALLRRRRQP